MNPLAAAVISLGVALAGWAVRALTGGGTLVATGIGGVILAATGWPGGAVLGIFFVTSSAVSRLTSGAQWSGLFGQGNRRDAWQVLANGGVAAGAALLERSHPGLGLWLVTSTLAGAAADTWATSLGALSPRPPRDLVQGVTVCRGASGGVTVVGTVGGVAGALLVAATGGLIERREDLALAALLSGIAGMLADSLLGSLAQGKFSCPACRVPTERPVHQCGTPAQHQGGWRWLDNNGVNALATAFAAAVGAAAWHWSRA